MNLEFEILKEHSKRNTVKIARWVGGDKERFAELMALFLNGEKIQVQRSSWIVSLCVEKYPNLALPWLKKMIAKMQEKNIHPAIPRNITRTLQFVSIPQSLQGIVVNSCFNFLQSIDAPIAVKAFSMTVIAHIAEQQPELIKELQLTIQQLMPFGSPGIQSRGKKILQQLSY